MAGPRILTTTDAVHLSMVLDAAQRNAHVARLTNALVVRGTARSIGDAVGNFAGASQDVRDCYLRVTVSPGIEAFWLVSELMAEIPDGVFGVN